MDRLDNSRVMLNSGEKDKDGASGQATKVAADTPKGEKPVEVVNEEEQSKRPLAAKYKVKGPKPRPILRQDGVVITGTPIDPISASGTMLSFSSDPEYIEADAKMASRGDASKKVGSKKAIAARAAADKKSLALKGKEIAKAMDRSKRGALTHDRGVKLERVTDAKRESGVVTQGLKVASKQNREARRAIQAVAAASNGKVVSGGAKGRNVSDRKIAKLESAKKDNSTKKTSKAGVKAASGGNGKIKSGRKAPVSKRGVKRANSNEARAKAGRSITANGRGERPVR
jgi:hypothetical protein